nr:PTS sugar transporter subunit IIA [Pacificimonas pallii]
MLCKGCIEVELAAETMAGLMQALAEMLAGATSLDAALIAEALVQRERVGSTAFGGGFAVPHARLSGLDNVVGAFAVLTRPVDLRALDGEPVDLVYALISPEEAGADHLKALAAVSRLMRDNALVEKLRGASSADAAHALLVTHGWSQAA